MFQYRQILSMRCIFNAGIDRKLANLGATIVPSLTYSGYRNTGVVSQLGNSIYNLWLRNNKKDELGNYIFVLYGDAFDKPLSIPTYRSNWTYSRTVYERATRRTYKKMSSEISHA